MDVHPSNAKSYVFINVNTSNVKASFLFINLQPLLAIIDVSEVSERTVIMARRG